MTAAVAPTRTRPLDAIVFDAEIVRCVPDRNAPRDPSLEYCGGWGDYVGMGVSVLCAFDTRTRTPRVFMRDNLSEFAAMIDGRIVLGFNSRRFDAPLLAAHGVEIVGPHYDLRLAVTRAARVGPMAKGYKLDALARANLGAGKPMSGALAPVLWQRGRLGEVVDYCLSDVMQTARIAQLARVVDPVTGAELELEPCVAGAFE